MKRKIIMVFAFSILYLSLVSCNGADNMGGMERKRNQGGDEKRQRKWGQQKKESRLAA